MSQHGCPERLSNRSKGFQEDGPSQQTMEVLVETLTGTAFEMTVSPSDTIFAIKSKIFRVEGIPVSQQHLVYNLKELEDAWSLQEVGISDGARLRLVLGMRGGPISTRRLPPPPAAAAAAGEPWRDIETLLDSNREDGEWGGGGGGGGSGWKVTVLVFRDGDRVNMVRVRENHDGTYSPLALALDHNKSSSTSSLNGGGSGSGSGGGGREGVGSVQENAVTMGKMMALRRRMEDLSVLRRPLRPDNNDKADIQKTRSEETLSVPSLLDEPVDLFKHRTYTTYGAGAVEEDSFAPLYDGKYTRYDYDCSFADRYTLLPPIGTRADSDHSVQEAVADSERLNVSEAVSGLVEPGVGVEVAPTPEPRRPARPRAPLPAADYGPVVCGSVGVGGGGGVGVGVGVGAWGGVGLGLAGAVSASSLHAAGHVHPHAHPHAHAHASSRPAPPRAHRPKLSDALFSSSTSDLDNLKRNSRILPALSRHRNREHLHLSDEGLHLHHRGAPDLAPASAAPPSPTPPSTTPPSAGDGPTAAAAAAAAAPGERKVRVRCGLCRKRLSIATVHRCRCGAEFCAPHRYAEVHGCLYDYKQPQPQPPNHYLLVQAPKLPKI